MFRTLSVLAVAACVAVPVLAEHTTTVKTQTVTTVTIPASDYAYWRDRGYSTQDIFYAYNTSAATKRGVNDIFTMRKSGDSWEKIAKECGCEMNAVYGTPVSTVAGERITLAQAGGSMARSVAVYPSYERKLSDRFYRDGYRLTPRDFQKYRAAGYTAREVYMIANAARATGLDPGVFANAISRGMYARQISLEYGITPNRLTAVLPEWRTPEWAAAINEPAMDRDRLDVWW
jgi:hypothetical protein